MAGDDDDSPTNMHTEEAEAEEDALPDWRKFAQFAKSNKPIGAGEDSSNLISIPFIPKRGEKDFEPLTLDSSSSSSLPSTTAALLSSYQQSILMESRNALFTALSSGTRHHSSKASNSFTWNPKTMRASCDHPKNVTYGLHFGTMGQYSTERGKVELRGEEAIYLNERGVIELWKEEDDGRRVPMSVQQAWSVIIGTDNLTPERFQIYTYLKRLGYTLTRARDPITTPATRPPATQSYFSIFHYLRLPFVSFHSLIYRLATATVTRLRQGRKRMILGLTRVLAEGAGQLRSLVHGRRWSTYHQIFDRLQIIPTSWDTPLPRPPQSRSIPLASQSNSPPTRAAPTPCKSTDALPGLEEFPYQTFFNLYKPGTKFRKTSPPRPDFEIVVINTATTSLPDLFEFGAMFDTVAFPEEDTLLPPPRPLQPTLPPRLNPNQNLTRIAPAASGSTSSPSATPPSMSSATRTHRPRPSYPVPASTPSYLSHILSYTPFFSSLRRTDQRRKSTAPSWKKDQPSIYPRLKVGRRSIILAVVDGGTTSFWRFGESEFGKLTWAGDGRSA